jgi:hypothetical protein
LNSTGKAEVEMTLFDFFQHAKNQKFKQFESNTFWGMRDNWEPPEFIDKGKLISLGGIPKELVYYQDRVFVVSENAGEV